jgi:hypothetical protein
MLVLLSRLSLAGLLLFPASVAAAYAEPAVVPAVVPAGGPVAETPPDRRANAPADTDQMDGFVTGQMERAGIPGVAYAIVGSEGVEHEATFGTDATANPSRPRRRSCGARWPSR